MKLRITIFLMGLRAILPSLSAQEKLADNDAGTNTPSNGPAYLVAKDDDSRIMYRGNTTIYWYDLATGAETTSSFANNPSEWEVFGETIFARDNHSSGETSTDLVFANIDDVSVTELDYFTGGSNFPRIMGIDGNGNFYGSGKFNPDNAGRDLIKLSADRTTVTRPADNVSSGNDLINKNKYRVQMMPFSDDKILIKSYRTSSDEEYFVWDDGDATYTQVTDRANTNTDATNNSDYPLASSYATNEIAFYYSNDGTLGVYTTDGSAADATKITDVITAIDITAFAATSNRILWADTDGGDEELYVYNGSSTSEIELNVSGSSSPRDFVKNGDLVMFIADDGDGYEPHIYDGSSANKLIDLATGADAMTSNGTYFEPIIWAAGNGFVFVANDGTADQFYYTDGTEVVLLDNGDTYDGYFTDQELATYVTDEYFYFTDIDKDVFRTPIPDNIYTSSAWTEGTPVTSGTLQDLYFDESYTLTSSEVLFANTIQIASGVTLTVSDGTTLVIESDMHNGGTIVVESGGSLLINSEGSLFGTDLSITRRTSFDMNTGQYSVVGSPVTSATTTDLGSNAVVYSYDETQDYGLDRFISESSGTGMTPGVGYFSAFTGDVNGDITFTGEPNTGDVTFSLSFTDRTDAGDGYNLVANPYAASVSLSDLASDNADIDGNFWIWDDNNTPGAQGTDDDYIVINSSGVVTQDSEAGGNSFDGYVRSGQGFFVKATTAGTLTFSADQQAQGNNGAGNYFRTAKEIDFTRFKISLEGNGQYAETLLAFRQSATVGIDRGMDATSISERETQIFTMINGDRHSIQTLENHFEREPIEIGLQVEEAGSYLISLKELQNVPEGIEINLVTQEGEINLLEQEYTLDITEKSEKSFQLFVSPGVILNSPNLGDQSLVVYSVNDVINIQVHEESAVVDLQLTDLAGRQILKLDNQKIENNQWSAKANLVKGNLYILNLMLKGTKHSVKFIY